ncbi:MAG: tetratricopeptide repeat protein [Flavisolibacter sp.]
MLAYSRKIFLTILLLILSVLLLAQSPRLHLEINGQTSLTLFHDQPLIISLSLSNATASEAEQWNRSTDQGLMQLEQMKQSKKMKDEAYNQEKSRLVASKKIISPAIIGSEQKPAIEWVKMNLVSLRGDSIGRLRAKIFDSAMVPAKMVLDANAYYLLRWGMDRSTVQAMKSGKYFLSIEVADAVSNRVELTILALPLPSLLLRTQKMQLELGNFALLYGRPDSATIHANTILKTNPSSIDGLVLLGEANIQKNNFHEALSNFETARLNFYKQNPHTPEPPEYIDSMIGWLKSK